MQLVSLGDLSLDIVIRAGSAIATGSDVAGTITLRLGGSAANTARAFAGLGGTVAFVGAVGGDRIGRRLVRELRRDGVRPCVSVVAGMPTARIGVLLGEAGERSFVTVRGAADCLEPAQLRPSWFRRAGVLHLPAYSLLNQPLGAAATLAARMAHEAGALVSVDLASAEPLRAFGAEPARVAVTAVAPDILFANEAEEAVLGGRLSELSPLVVVKLGAGGCRVGDVLVSTEPIAAADTTGAGDAFDAGFLFGWLRGGGAEPAGRMGHAAAAKLLTAPRRELDL